MRPRKSFGKFLKKSRGRYSSSFATTDVLNVSDVRFDLPRIIRIKRQLPKLFAHFPSRVDDFVDQILIGSENRSVNVTKRDTDSAGESREINYAGCAKLLRVSNRISKNQTALSVRVYDFDGLAGHRSNDIAGFGCFAGGKIFRAGRNAEYWNGWL